MTQLKLTRQGVRDLNAPGNKRREVPSDCSLGLHDWGFWESRPYSWWERVRRCLRCPARDVDTDLSSRY